MSQHVCEAKQWRHCIKRQWRTQTSCIYLEISSGTWHNVCPDRFIIRLTLRSFQNIYLYRNYESSFQICVRFMQNVPINVLYLFVFLFTYCSSPLTYGSMRWPTPWLQWELYLMLQRFIMFPFGYDKVTEIKVVAEYDHNDVVMIPL